MSQQKPRPLDADTQEIPKAPSIPRDAQEDDDYSEGVPAEDYPLNPDPPAEDEPVEAPAKPAKEDDDDKK